MTERDEPYTPSLDELERKAREASVWGRWAIWTDLTEGGFVHVGNEDGVIPEGEIATADDAEPNPIAKAYTPEIAAFIAAADPATVLSLIARIRESNRMIEAVRQEERAHLADAINEIRNDPTLIELADKYGGWYQGQRTGLERAENIARGGVS